MHYIIKYLTDLENISECVFVIWTNPEGEEHISPIGEVQIFQG